MIRSRLLLNVGWFLAALVWTFSAAERAEAQFGGLGGVAVDAQGTLQLKTFADPGGQLTRQRIAAAKAMLDAKLATYSKLRKVSLNRLEAALRQRDGIPTDEMKYLAGLLRAQYVFLYPETNDLVIAGPAEGWITDPSGRVVGITTGRPVVQLQDLVVALRAFPPGRSGVQLIGCSIDPTPEGLAAMQQFLRQWGSQAVPAQTAQIVEGLRTSLGLQKIAVMGVPPNTRFAQVLVEADYRMKLIGIGMERPPVKLVSYVERVSPEMVKRNALERWYFVPDYQCVRVADDGLGMELVGSGVKLVGEAELVGPDGHRRPGANTNPASRAFTAAFTKLYPELAEKSPVYAELRNLIDLAIAAAFIQRHDYYDKVGWRMELLGSEEKFPVQTYHAPKQVMSVVNAIWRGNTLMTPIGGGVEIQPAQALASANQLRDENQKVALTRAAVKPELPPGRWWWD